MNVTEQLSVDVRDLDGQALVTVAGEVTRHNAYTLRRALDAAASMYTRITVDLSRTTRLDPLELAELLVVGEGLKARDGDLVIVGAPGPSEEAAPTGGPHFRDLQQGRPRARPGRNSRTRSCRRPQPGVH